jgi:lysophospholipase L1-like esterase
MNRRFILVVLAVLISTALVLAQAPQGPPQGAPGGGPGGARGGGRGGPALPANQPSGPLGEARHQGFMEIAKKGNIDLLFMGDSITDWFANPLGARGGGEPRPATGLEVWNKYFGAYKPANFGIAGDTTQGVLWRVQNGELEGFKAKLIVHMLGTNNLNRNPVDEIVDGNRLIVEEYKKRQPQAKVLLLGIFPRGRTEEQAAPLRVLINDHNAKLAKLADNKQVFYMDIGDKFLGPDGLVPADIMADGLHPTAKGYEIWANAIIDRVKTLMQ